MRHDRRHRAAGRTGKPGSRQGSLADETAGREATAAALARMLAFEEIAEVLAAFTEKRAPQWTGR